MPITKYRGVFADLVSQVLKMIAYGETSQAVASLLCSKAEHVAAGSVCSLLAVDPSGKIRLLAGPSLPHTYVEALDGLTIGPKAGSCGTAAFRREPVLVTDIATDPLWDDYKGLALPLGLRACWSTPIFSRDRRVIGAFAFYYRETRGPTELEAQIVERCSDLCSILIENDEIRRRMHDLAFVDALTQLPNRGSFDARIRALVAQRDMPFALLLADLDHLKSVNDSFGHDAGDSLIVQAAQGMKTMVTPRIESFRLGGDEFAFIVPNCDTHAVMRQAAEQLIEAVRNTPSRYLDHTLHASITVGGALSGPHIGDFGTLFQNADLALYQAKTTGRGSFVNFDPSMRMAIARRRESTSEVDDALTENRIVAHYQPIVRLDTAEIVGVEALARLTMRDGSIKSAAQFQPAFADFKLSRAITQQMLTAVVRDVRAWLDAGIPLQHVGFNVTTADFQAGDLEERLTSAFADHGVPLSHLIIEVNEAVFMNDKLVGQQIRSLRARGTRVALDDFGTGYASLTHLLHFPVDIIKIDKQFVDGLHKDNSSLAIVQALMDIAGRLDLRVVAEGIECSEQVELLRSLGCNLGQGYHFARALPANDAGEMLHRFAQKPAGDKQAVHEAPRRARGGKR